MSYRQGAGAGSSVLHTSRFRSSPERVAIMVVLQLPPRLSRSTEVIMELR